MVYDLNNVFAKILRHEIPCKKIYENDTVLAFYDIAPKSRIHALVIPKKPVTSFNEFVQDLSESEIASFYKGLHETVKVLGVEEAGYTLVSHCGEGGGQEVPHYHVHIMAK